MSVEDSLLCSNYVLFLRMNLNPCTIMIIKKSQITERSK